MTIPVDGTAGLPLFELNTESEAAALPAMGNGASGTVSFEDMFGEVLATHSAKAHHASEMAASFAAGKTEDIHGTMIAVKEVEIELRVISNVRRKVVDAFQELWRMNI